ncbi:MAG: methyltransferase [Flavobacteriales bacterium]|nr:methyltransferase [Flavobacteriales bacterium]
MEEIEFNEDDLIGGATLDAISDANLFNEWMYETIKPHCGGKVLEIGSGIGNISEFFIKDKFPLMLTDIRDTYCSTLENKFEKNEYFLGSKKMDLTDPEFESKFHDEIGQYDTVFALNVVEHIKDHTLALENCRLLLRNGGKLIILVPSYQWLFNDFDHGLGHYRRYTKSSLSKVFKSNQFQMIHKQYFNFIGIAGWFVSGSVLRKKVIPVGQMKLYNALVPIFKIIDKVIFNQVGLSTIIVGKK